MIVGADTTPINYLIIVGEIHLLPELYTQVFIPKAVEMELQDLYTPTPVKDWISQCPSWLGRRRL
jgi:predicted nucleic acid-binding protein